MDPSDLTSPEERKATYLVSCRLDLAFRFLRTLGGGRGTCAVLARRRFFFICTSFYPASATDDTTWQLFLLHFQSFFFKFTTDFTSFVWLSNSAVSRFLFYFDFDFLHWGTQCRSLVQLNPLPFFLKKRNKPLKFAIFFHDVEWSPASFAPATGPSGPGIPWPPSLKGV